MMSRSTIATRMESARAFAAQLAPVHDVRYLAAARAVQVELADTAEVYTLLACHARLRHAHIKSGAYTRVDEYVRLHLHGSLDDIGPVIITLPLHRARRAEQARMVRDQATGTDTVALLERLSAQEQIMSDPAIQLIDKPTDISFDADAHPQGDPVRAIETTLLLLGRMAVRRRADGDHRQAGAVERAIQEFGPIYTDLQADVEDDRLN